MAETFLVVRPNLKMRGINNFTNLSMICIYEIKISYNKVTTKQSFNSHTVIYTLPYLSLKRRGRATSFMSTSPPPLHRNFQQLPHQPNPIVLP